MKIILFILSLSIFGIANGQINPNISSTSIPCAGQCVATLTSNPSGGVSPYTFSWSPGGQTTQTITGLCAGTYLLTVTDSMGSIATGTYSITQPTQLNISCSANPDTIVYGDYTTLNASPAGGTLPYISYNWAPSTGLSCNNCSTPIAMPPVSICYTVTIADTNGCTNTCTICVTVDSTSGINEYVNNNSLTISPNPFTTQTILQTSNPYKNANLTFYNSFGQQVKQVKNISGQTITLYRDNLTRGIYFIRLTEDDKVIATDKLIISD
jgi:hypothetical protein